MTEIYTYFEDLLQQLPEIPEDSVVSRTMLDSPAAKITLFGFAAGQEMTEHTAAYPALLQVLKGQGEITLNGEVHQARPGTLIHMPPKLPHSVRASEPFVFLLTLIR
jgi:quercetin dioxygenase-like cupin family protein